MHRASSRADRSRRALHTLMHILVLQVYLSYSPGAKSLDITNEIHLLGPYFTVRFLAPAQSLISVSPVRLMCNCIFHFL